MNKCEKFVRAVHESTTTDAKADDQRKVPAGGGFVNWTVEDAGPYNVNDVLSDECAEFVGKIHESTATDAKADDQWSSLQGYADKRDVEDAGPYRVNDVLSDEYAEFVGVHDTLSVSLP